MPHSLGQLGEKIRRFLVIMRCCLHTSRIIPSDSMHSIFINNQEMNKLHPHTGISMKIITTPITYTQPVSFFLRNIV